MSIREKYPNKIPVVLKPTKTYHKFTKLKYLVPRLMTLGSFVYLLRQREVSLNPEKSLLIFVDDNIPKMNETMEEIDVKYRNIKDDNLIFTITSENTFG